VSLNHEVQTWLQKMLAEHAPMTRRALALGLGLSPETVYRILAGERPGDLPYDTLLRMEKATGMRAWHILRHIQEGRVFRVDQPIPRK
jgi:plasmid maintenance system antidote protein VapI